jgi:hypothetical protein
MRSARLVLLATCCFLVGCAALRGPAYVQDTLYFGMSTPSEPLSPAEWKAFVDNEVTPRFPDGLTQWGAQGQWKGGPGVMREDSRVLVLVHAPGQEADAKLAQLIAVYKALFKQESVLRVRQAVEAHF